MRYSRGVAPVWLLWMTLILVAVLAIPQHGLGQAQTGVMTVAKSTEPPTLDPQQDAGGPASEVQESIFEPLVFFDFDMKLKGLLASSWEMAPDGRAYTFRLRQGVKFHDGTDVNAEAVKFTFDRALGRVDNRKNRYVTLIEQLTDVQVVDAYTVRFVLEKPMAAFVNNLAHMGFAILSPAAFRRLGTGFGRQPVGTGPFEFAAWASGQQIVLKRFGGYWQKGRPKLAGIIFKIIPDENTRLIALESGQADIVIGTPEQEVGRLRKAGRFDIHLANSLRTVFFMFSQGLAPFSEVKVREAVAAAIDNQGIAKTILEGLHRPATAPTFAPGVWGVDTTVLGYPFDLNRAGQLLDEAGWRLGQGGVRQKDGKPLEFPLYVTQNRYPKDMEIGASVQGALQKVGIKAELRTMEWEAYRNAIFNRRLPVFLFGAGVTTGDLDYVITILFHTSSRYTQGNNPAEGTIIEGQTELNAEKRRALYARAQRTIRDQYLWKPVYWQSIIIATAKRVKNFKPHAMERLYLYDVWME
jgi:ABC-type transport system substrate-binding protein